MRITEKQAAYEAGQTAGWANLPYVNPYDSREQEELHLAFIDGYEDGKAQKKEFSHRSTDPLDAALAEHDAIEAMYAEDDPTRSTLDNEAGLDYFNRYIAGDR